MWILLSEALDSYRDIVNTLFFKILSIWSTHSKKNLQLFLYSYMLDLDRASFTVKFTFYLYVVSCPFFRGNFVLVAVFRASVNLL